jgi:peptide/nickel transport system substrate-binding protein
VPYPTLAASLPERTPRGTRLTLRPGMATARGLALDSRDLVFSLERARAAGAVALLAPFGKVTRHPDDGWSALVKDAEPAALARALASPLTALLPRGFRRERPDGTGAFLAEPSGSRLRLRRNVRAARGAAYLAEIDVQRATDLADSPRAFEAGETDVAWLAGYLHRPRPDAVELDAGVLGWIVLHSGREAGEWGLPGVAQQLLDAVSPASLGHLGLGTLPAPRGTTRWGGPPAELLAPDDAPQLGELGRVLAAQLGTPGHELSAVERPRRELRSRKARGSFSLMLDVVRRVGPSPRDTMLGLIAAADPSQARRPPGTGASDPRALTRLLPVGIVGELRVAGAHAGELRHMGEWDLGAVWRPAR